MPYDSRFGPGTQTPEQRAALLHKMELICPGLFSRASALTIRLYGRYVKGELSWGEVRALRGLQDQPIPLPIPPESNY